MFTIVTQTHVLTEKQNWFRILIRREEKKQIEYCMFVLMNVMDCG